MVIEQRCQEGISSLLQVIKGCYKDMIHGCIENASMEVQGCFKDKLSMLQEVDNAFINRKRMISHI